MQHPWGHWFHWEASCRAGTLQVPLGTALVCLGGVPPPHQVPALGATAVQRFLLHLGGIAHEAGVQQGSGARKLQMPFLGNPGD